MDRFKWYSSYSVMMDRIALSGSPFQKSFLTEVYETFDQDSTGIESVLFLYMRMNTVDNPYQDFYDIFFSVDRRRLQMKDLNPAAEGDPFYVVDISTGERVEETFSTNAMYFIMEQIIQKNVMNIGSQIQQGKSIVLVQVDFDDSEISTDYITSQLRKVFNKHFVEVLGEM
jgi:hypothetical protein